MPKPIDYYQNVIVKSVQKISDMDYEEWKWREGYIDFQGILSIWESTKRFKGQRYISFNNLMGDWFHTGYGEYTIQDNIITMKTNNSLYEFKIIYK